MAPMESGVIAVLSVVVIVLAGYAYVLRIKLAKASYVKSTRNALARDPLEKLSMPWEPTPAARAAWKLAFSLVNKSLKQQKYKRLQEQKHEDGTEKFIEGLVHLMINRAVEGCATHGGRLRLAGELGKALDKRRGLRQLKQLADRRRSLRLHRRNGQLAPNALHQATSCGAIRSVGIEFENTSFPLRPGTVARTGPLALPPAPLGAGPPPGKLEAERYVSLNASSISAGAGQDSAALLRAAAEATVPGQLPDHPYPQSSDGGDNDEVPAALRAAAGTARRSRGALWLAEQDFGNALAAVGSLVISFGDARRGQLGLDPASAERQASKNTIITIEPLRGSEPLQVEAAGVASFVVGSRGQVWAFGSNRSMELGTRKEIAQVQAPQRIKSLRDRRAVQVASAASASGQAHTLVLADDGQVFTFGTSSSGALAQGPEVRQSAPLLVRMTSTVPIRQVLAGARHSILVSDEGRVFTVGDNSHGQLGRGKRDPANQWTPKFVDTPGLVEGELKDMKVRLIAVGDDHNLATTQDDLVFAWGANANGQLGIGRVGDQAAPVPIRDLQDLGVTSLACGSRHSLVVSSNRKKVWSFGSNVQGQLGHGESSVSEGFQLCSPTLIAPLSEQSFTEVIQVAAAGNHSMVVTHTGELWSWGDNAYGQLGFPRAGHGHRVSQGVSGALQAMRYSEPRAPPPKQARSRAALEVDAPRLFAEGVARLFVPVKVVGLALYKVFAVSTSDMHTLVMAG